MNIETIKAILTVAGQLDGVTDNLTAEQRERRKNYYLAWNEKRERRTKHLNVDVTKNPCGFSETSAEKIEKGIDCSQDKIFPYHYGLELKYLPVEPAQTFQETSELDTDDSVDTRLDELITFQAMGDWPDDDDVE